MKKISKKFIKIGIDKNTKLIDLLDSPKLVEVLQQHNIPCLFCPFSLLEAQYLTLTQVCQMYDLDIASLLQDLNKIVNVSKKKQKNNKSIVTKTKSKTEKHQNAKTNIK